MFTELEKEYNALSKERKFNRYYWTCAMIIVGINTILANYIKNVNSIVYPIIFLIFLSLIIIYFYMDYKKTTKNIKDKKSLNLVNRISLYFIENNNSNLNNLISILPKYNFRTKNDIKLAIDYYNGKHPLKIESSFLAWFISAILSLSSFIEIAYDKETNTLDYNKVSLLLSTATGYIITLTIPILVLKLLINSIFLSKSKIYSELSENLSYIYLNFNKYVNQLTK